MKFTINTDAKTITIYGSYEAEEFTALMKLLPPEWAEYTIVGPVEEFRYVPDPIWWVVPYTPPQPINPRYTSAPAFPGPIPITCSSHT
jgi:hypothetical protein